MKKVWLLLNTDNSIMGCAESYLDNSIEYDLDTNVYDISHLGRYFYKDGSLVEMTRDEWEERNPMWNKPYLSDTGIAKAQVKVLRNRTDFLEDCVLELSNQLYSTGTGGVARMAVNVNVEVAGTDKITDLYVEKIIMEEITFNDVPDSLKAEVEQKIISMGFGYFLIKKQMEEEENNK